VITLKMIIHKNETSVSITGFENEEEVKIHITVITLKMCSVLTTSNYVKEMEPKLK
jgi:hypothetical protein